MPTPNHRQQQEVVKLSQVVKAISDGLVIGRQLLGLKQQRQFVQQGHQSFGRLAQQRLIFAVFPHGGEQDFTKPQTGLRSPLVAAVVIQVFQDKRA